MTGVMKAGKSVEKDGETRGVHRCGKAYRRHNYVPWRQRRKFRGKK